MPGGDLAFAALQISERKTLHQRLMSRLQGGQSGQTEQNEVRGAAACMAVCRAPGLPGRTPSVDAEGSILHVNMASELCHC